MPAVMLKNSTKNMVLNNLKNVGKSCRLFLFWLCGKSLDELNCQIKVEKQAEKIKLKK